MIGQNPSVSKPNRVTCRHPLVFLYEFEVYFMYSSETIGSFVEVLNFNRVFLKLNWFI